jgi:hypothetical protein
MHNNADSSDKAQGNITTQEPELFLEYSLLLSDEETDILTQLTSADHVAQEMEQKLDAVLDNLDRLLAELDSGDMDGSRENSENESGSREG